MKLTMDQVEAKLTAAWGAQAHVIPYRVSGNRYVYVATDHNGHRMPLDKSWTGGHLLLEPTVGTWPWLKPDPWPDAVLDAAQLALVYFTNQGDKEAVKRLPRAQVIAEGRNWRRVGDKFDTWLMPSCSKLGVVYMVNGRCTCPDPVRWCKHRLGRALAKRAAELLKSNDGAGGGGNTPAPASESSPPLCESHFSTVPLNGQPQRIDLTVAYKASEASLLAHMNANGQLIRFTADGQDVAPPATNMPELYRWLEEHNYVPDDFKWLGWEHGLRQRKQTYLHSNGRDTALPVDYSRGRAKLFKEAGR